MSNQDLTINTVEKAFKNWRINKTNLSERIPESLCNQVKILLQTYPCGKIFGRLGISRLQAINKGLFIQPTAVKQKLQQVSSKNSFVKIPITQLAIDTVTQKNNNSLTLQHGDTKLSINCPSNEQIQLFICTILR